MNKTMMVGVLGALFAGAVVALLLNGIMGARSAQQLMEKADAHSRSNRAAAAQWTYSYLVSRYPYSSSSGAAMAELVRGQFAKDSVNLRPQLLFWKSSAPHLGPLGAGALSTASVFIICFVLPRKGIPLAVLVMLFQGAATAFLTMTMAGKIHLEGDSAATTAAISRHWVAASLVLVALSGAKLLSYSMKDTRAGGEREDKVGTTGNAKTRWAKRALTLVSASAVVVAGLTAYDKAGAARLPNRRQFVVEATVANVRQGPSTSFTVIGTVKKGDRLSVIGTYKDWNKVMLPDDGFGWVSAQVGIVTNPVVANGTR